MAAVEYFLKLNGIKGGSNDAKHKDEIDLDAFGWGVIQSGSSPAAGSGAGAGKAQIEDLSVTARTSIASPALFVACATGQHIRDAVLTARHAGGSDFLRIALTDVVVTSYDVEGTEVDHPVDNVSFAFGRVEVEYRPILPTGAAGPPVKVSWDLKANRKL